MLTITAILRVWLPRDSEPNDTLTQSRLRVGNLAFVVISVVYVLVSVWQR